MRLKTSVFMRGSVVKLGQRNSDAGQCVNTPGAAQKGLVSVQPHDTADRSVRIPVRSKKYPTLYALVDPEDAELVSRYTWYALVTPHATYAQANDGGRWLYMHRLVMGATKGQVVDHKNHDGLDNRRSTNLRLCDDKKNQWNRSPRRGTPSGLIGVSLRKNGRFQAFIHGNGKSLHLGIYDTAEEAGRARDAAARAFYGEFAVLNFPDERGGFSKELRDRLVRVLYEATWEADWYPFEAADEVEIAFTEQQLDALGAEIGRTSVVVDRYALVSVIGDIANAHSEGDTAQIEKAMDALDGLLGKRMRYERPEAT